MLKRHYFNIFISLMCLSLFLSLAAPVTAQSTATKKDAEQFGIKEKPARKETVLDLIFGSTPEMPTERGILVIDAFEDLDNNGIRSEDEPVLRNEISCRIDKVDYPIPAFIPGLDYNNRYEVRCSGTNYYPTMPDKEILIEHRGHVIEIELPCRKSKLPSSTNPG